MSIEHLMSIWPNFHPIPNVHTRTNVHPSQCPSIPKSIQLNFHLTQCLSDQFQKWSLTITDSHGLFLEMLLHLKTTSAWCLEVTKQKCLKNACFLTLCFWITKWWNKDWCLILTLDFDTLFWHLILTLRISITNRQTN